MSNFQFLESHWIDLAKLGDLSEKYVYSDPNTSIIKQGMLSEVMVKYMLAYDGIAEPAYDNTHANRIRILKNNDLLPNEIVTMYLDYATRQARRHIPMTMEDCKTKLDAFLRFNDADVLQDKGKVTEAIAKEFAESEFEKYRVIQVSLYESDFDKLMNDMEKNDAIDDYFLNSKQTCKPPELHTIMTI